MTVEFDRKILEDKFQKAEDILLDIHNVSVIHYEGFNHETFDVHNQDFLGAIAQKPIVYCIWTGETEESLEYKYIGHVGKQYSRQRLRNHLTKKHKKTGAQLKNTILALKEKHVVGISYVVTEPHYMRKALEDWLIEKNSGDLKWNKAGKAKQKN
ncbi:hypothetical protein [Salinimicrobium sp. WS361]|uniref:hypothetical protein n=1 Tax=Salinimicrobium sp. WS361 TaxID=3425123 RepID=UPI003D6FDED8